MPDNCVSVGLMLLRIDAEWRIYASVNQSSLVQIMAACRQAITWAIVEILFIGPLGTNFSDILIGIQTFWSRKCAWKFRLLNGVHLSRPHWDKYFPWAEVVCHSRSTLLDWLMWLAALISNRSISTQIAKFMGPTLGPTWVLLAQDGPHVGPVNLAIRVGTVNILRPGQNTRIFTDDIFKLISLYQTFEF